MPVRRFAIIAALLCDLVIAVAAQVPPAPPGQAQPAVGTGVIVGQTVDGDTGQPVAGAIVLLSMAPAAMANAAGGGAFPIDQLMGLDIGSMLSGTRQAIADGQGRFAFSGVAAGTVSLSSNKPGWSGGVYGQERPDGAPMPLVLGSDARLGSVSLRLWKNAALGGTVVDEVGEPIVGLAVRVLRRTWMAGHSRFAAAGSGTTDDRGVYRISALKPGEYVAVITQTPVTAPVIGPSAPPDPAALQSMIASSGPGTDPNALLVNVMSMMAGGPSSGGIRRGDWQLQTSGIGTRFIPPGLAADGRMLAYRTTFYPNVSSASQAAAVTLRSGEERSGIDFQMRPGPVVEISGALTADIQGLGNIAVRLIPSGSDALASDGGFEAATTTTRANGSFAFLAVPDGQYALRVVRTPRPNMSGMARGLAGSAPAMIQNGQGNRAVSLGPLTMDMMMPAPPPIPAEPTLWAEVPVSVTDSDITGLNVALRSGFRVSGHARFEGRAAPPPMDRLRRIPIVLDRADTSGVAPSPLAGFGTQQGGQFDERGDFTTYGVVPGRYFVRVPFAFSGWTLKSAELGGRDLADVPIDIENADVTGVVLTFTDTVTDLSGAVRDGQNNTLTKTATVVIVPAQQELWTDFGSSPRRFRTVQVGEHGRYHVTGLPPGDYLIGAVSAASDWQNPAVLQALAPRAVKMTMGEGERKILDVRLLQ